MASTSTLLTIYSAAGLCETAGIAVTIIDIRAKASAARKFMGPQPPAEDIRTRKRDSAAAARGVLTFGHLKRLGDPIQAALTGPWLAVAAGLLLAGIVLGTIGNALSATR